MQRFDSLLAIMFGAFNQEYQFVSDGVMGPSVWENRMRSLRRLLPLPGYRQWWNEWGDIHSDDFRELIDGLIREGEAAE